ncbi:hypothetical protein SLEP1_g18031 [Rubroshorea leprosula]|uniref:Uncharacterized protein n=1 Tax=Rubroshorea leprosula TaxID=152421 RepID=A0AAV5J546_9ROSI|nr:hypothetical protein SLEP1_g18031 [Rubroshorea leprosula]
MKRWRGWQCFKQPVHLPPKCMLLKVCQLLRPRVKGSRPGLQSLYKDMESCRGYEDIQVMWDMIHSSCPANVYETPSSNKRPSHWSFCFRPT